MKDVWGVDEVALAIISHRHGDHYGGFAKILRDFTVRRVVMNLVDCPNRTTDDTIRGLLNTNNVPAQSVGADTIDVDGVRFIILPPDPVDDPCPREENDNSIVVRMEFGEFSMLFTGDAERDEREFLMEAADERGVEPEEAAARIEREAERFNMVDFLERSLNDDLSGGEKKRSEIFQMAVLEPRMALLDEIDSGLDIDAVRQVAEAVEAMRSPDLGVVMITHYSRILRFLSPDRIHVMIDGRIVDSGGTELAEELEAGGYGAVRERLGIVKPAAAAVRKPADFFTDTPFDV